MKEQLAKGEENKEDVKEEEKEEEKEDDEDSKLQKFGNPKWL